MWGFSRFLIKIRHVRLLSKEDAQDGKLDFYFTSIYISSVFPLSAGLTTLFLSLFIFGFVRSITEKSLRLRLDPFARSAMIWNQCYAILSAREETRISGKVVIEAATTAARSCEEAARGSRVFAICGIVEDCAARTLQFSPDVRGSYRESKNARMRKPREDCAHEMPAALRIRTMIYAQIIRDRMIYRASFLRVCNDRRIRRDPRAAARIDGNTGNSADPRAYPRDSNTRGIHATRVFDGRVFLERNKRAPETIDASSGRSCFREETSSWRGSFLKLSRSIRKSGEKREEKIASAHSTRQSVTLPRARACACFHLLCRIIKRIAQTRLAFSEGDRERCLLR